MDKKNEEKKEEKLIEKKVRKEHEKFIGFCKDICQRGRLGKGYRDLIELQMSIKYHWQKIGDIWIEQKLEEDKKTKKKFFVIPKDVLKYLNTLTHGTDA